MANLKDLIVNGSARLNSDVTISGKTTLSGAPTSDNEAATKKYVDDSIPSVPSPADVAPLMDGTATVGTSTDYAREDHVHPSDTTKVNKVNSSTDNAVVRFDGTSGAIQNSSVTVDDNGYLTASKIIKSGGTSSQFLKADGSVDTNTYLTSQVNSDWNATSGAAEILNKPTIPAAANSGKMKISANSDSAVNTLFDANSSGDTNAIKFIDGTNTQVTVTAASGSTPATVKYDIPSTATPSITSIETSYSDTTNNLSGYRGMLAKRKVYTGVLGVANGSAPNNNAFANRSVYFLTVHPRSFDSEWTIHYRVNIHLDDENQLYKSSSTASVINLGQLCRGTYDCILSGTASAYIVYSSFNSIRNTSYRPIYYHMYHGPTQAGFDEGYKIGVSFADAYNGVPVTDYSSGTAVVNTKYSRTIEVVIDECVNCTAELNDVLEIEADAYTANGTNDFANYTKLNSTYYTTNTVYSNSAGRWTYNSAAASNGLQEIGDSTDTSTIVLPYTKLTAGTNGIMVYSLVMQDSSGNWQSFTTTGGVSTSGAPANKTPNTTTAFRPGSAIYYVSVSSAVTSGNVTTGTARAYVALINLRYSINAYRIDTGKPVYIKGTIHNDGYFYIDGDQSDLTVPWWTQEPNVTNDGADRIYIKVSQGTYDTYRTDLISSGEMWHFDENGIFCRYYPGTGEEGSYLPLAGGTMSGNIAMGGNKITGVAPGASDNDVVVCKQTLLKDESDDFNAQSCKIVRLDEPSDNSDAATKNYVDTTVATSIATAIQGIDLNPSVGFTTIRAIDGSKNMNVAVMHYTTGHEPALLFDTPMKPNTVCHIITYRTGDTDYPSSSAGAFEIPKDICVGGQDSDTNFASSRNYVWINGTLVNGGSVDGSSDTVAFETSALGTREIDIFYSKQEDVSGQEDTYWYQTFIKVDQD